MDHLSSVEPSTEREYSASAASSGSGFFGATAINDGIVKMKRRDDQMLPPEAMDLMDNIQKYLEDIRGDEAVMPLLSRSDQKFIENAWDSKLEQTLNDLIVDHKMSDCLLGYRSLDAVFSALEGRQYDVANKEIIKITKQKAAFKENKKWIIAFKSIVRIAKSHNI